MRGGLGFLGICLCLSAVLTGCGDGTSPRVQSMPVKTSAVKTPAVKTAEVVAAAKTRAPVRTGALAKTTTAVPGDDADAESKTEERRQPKLLPAIGSARTLADDLRAAEQMEQELRGKRPQLPRPRALDDKRLLAAGLRKLSGKHLTLYTDLPSKPAIDELPAVWDQALPQWCEFFRVKADEAADWHMRGFLMGEKSRKKFQELDLIPPPVPAFEAGFTFNYEFWMYEQQSDYYRRHLLLHEGTHGFMLTMLGSCTSPWYAEATAELLGTHLWEKGKLTMRHFPRSRQQTPYHGRIKVVKEGFARREAANIDTIVSHPFDLHGPAAKDRQQGYAWCWASAAFLDGHSRYRDRFQLLCSRMRTPGEIPGQFRLWYEKDWNDLLEEWQVFVAGLEYGYDITSNEIKFLRGVPLPAGGKTVAVVSNRGWQSAEITLEAGKTYELSAEGRVVLAQQPKVWESQADGVTIRYQYGLPLGMLVAAVRIEDRGADQPLEISPFLRPIAVGSSSKITPEASGTLYLKINDSPAELADNTGQLKVRVMQAR